MLCSFSQIELPKVMNALLGVICDFYVFKLASFLYGSKAGTLAVSITECMHLAIDFTRQQDRLD